MQDCHWSAGDIVKEIDAGNKDAAAGMLQSEMNKMRPEDFKSLVDAMVSRTKDDTDDWNDVEYKTDSDGQITSVTINDGYLFDTVLAKKGVPSPLRLLNTLNGDCRINK